MTQIVPFEVFALRRLAKVQQNAAAELHRHADNVAEAAEQAMRACDAARRSCDESFRRARETLGRSVAVSEACLRALDQGDIEAMITLRDSLLHSRSRAAARPARLAPPRDGG